MVLYTAPPTPPHTRSPCAPNGKVIIDGRDLLLAVYKYYAEKSNNGAAMLANPNAHANVRKRAVSKEAAAAADTAAAETAEAAAAPAARVASAALAAENAKVDKHKMKRPTMNHDEFCLLMVDAGLAPAPTVRIRAGVTA